MSNDRKATQETTQLYQPCHVQRRAKIKTEPLVAILPRMKKSRQSCHWLLASRTKQHKQSRSKQTQQQQPTTARQRQTRAGVRHTTTTNNNNEKQEHSKQHATFEPAHNDDTRENSTTEARTNFLLHTSQDLLQPTRPMMQTYKTFTQ